MYIITYFYNKTLYKYKKMLYNNICNVEVTIKQQDNKNKEVTTMKNLKRIMPLAMAGAMLVSPVSMSAQAKVIDNNVNKMVTMASTYSFTGYGQINTNGVNLRAGASTSSTSLGIMAYNETVHIDYSQSVQSSSGSYTWLYVKRSNTGQTGYVAAQYVRRYA